MPKAKNKEPLKVVGYIKKVSLIRKSVDDGGDTAEMAVKLEGNIISKIPVGDVIITIEAVQKELFDEENEDDE